MNLYLSPFVGFLITILSIELIKKYSYIAFPKKFHPIRNDLVIDHSGKKNITPFGGLAMLFGLAGGVLTLTVCKYFVKGDVLFTRHFGLCCFIIIACFSIGFVDDLLKVAKQNTKGLNARFRLVLEILLASLIVFFIATRGTFNPKLINLSLAITIVPIPFFGIKVFNLGYFYYPLAIFTFVAILNSFNLTDGLDGLAGTQFVQMAIAMLVVLVVAFNYGLFSIICIALFCVFGFLIYNSHPASIFMGDSGSLMLGSIIGLVTINLHIEFALLFIAFIPFCESLSVILQVASFKTRGKRIFKIAPVHHHFEALGYKETKIVMSFFVVACLISAIVVSPFFLNGIN